MTGIELELTDTGEGAGQRPHVKVEFGGRPQAQVVYGVQHDIAGTAHGGGADQIQPLGIDAKFIVAANGGGHRLRYDIGIFHSHVGRSQSNIGSGCFDHRRIDHQAPPHLQIIRHTDNTRAANHVGLRHAAFIGQQIARRKLHGVEAAAVKHGGAQPGHTIVVIGKRPVKRAVIDAA